MRYFITFTCYGVHLHGDESGSVDLRHNKPGSPFTEVSADRVSLERQQMDQEPYHLDRARRTVVMCALQKVCVYRGWELLAAHVRTNHVHVVLEAEVRPEIAMHAFKSYASRSLNTLGIDREDRKRWTRHGSTRWLWKDGDVAEAIRYVVDRQGAAMEVYQHRSFTVAARKND